MTQVTATRELQHPPSEGYQRLDTCGVGRRVRSGENQSMVLNRSFRERLELAVIYRGLTLSALIAVLPLLHTITRSFSADAPITRGGGG